jgi:hypothetical protein
MMSSWRVASPLSTSAAATPVGPVDGENTETGSGSDAGLVRSNTLVRFAQVPVTASESRAGSNNRPDATPLAGAMPL